MTKRNMLDTFLKRRPFETMSRKSWYQTVLTCKVNKWIDDASKRQAIVSKMELMHG